ncbi:MAG TPA: penicillin-binding transpeptidase domain-containing protein [Ktedonobacteraceae bacterium]|jgi:peptidoglycan glycosyltransferase|nr:penicillin-binding transpeptidase domain-containing protein [Ktedonobacteraceae bacterium]
MNIASNIRKLAILFVAFFIAASAGLVYWQVVVAQQVTSNIHNLRSCLPANVPVRGKIYDRNGVLLAESVPTDTGTGCGYVRRYTDPSLAGLIGYYAGTQYSSTGIEQQYNNYLTGQVGTSSLENLVNQTLHQPPVGDSLYLTIDERIQKIVNQDFDTYVKIDNDNTFQSDRGAVIVMDPQTGAILAMVSRPTFNPNTLVNQLNVNNLAYYNQEANDTEQPLLERPTQGLFIPGSVFKTVTLMAGLNSGKTTLNQGFDQQHAMGPLYIDGQQIIGNNIQGYTFHFPVSTEYGYTHSDNLIYGQIGVNIGQQTWLNYAKRLYLSQKIPFDLPVATSTVLKNNQSLADNALAEDAFGQGYDNVTPLQMALINNVAADNGRLMRPTLISKITDKSNSVVQSFTPQELSSPVSQQTATEVRQAMYGVARCGSGSIVPDLYNSPWGIIGKTGTGQVSTNGTPAANAWMITQAPYSISNPNQLPDLTIVAMKENGGDGGLDVGPMVAKMYADIFSHHYVNAQTPAAPSSTYCCSEQLLQLGCS